MDRVNMKRVCIVVGLLTRNMRRVLERVFFSELASIVEESPNMWGARLSCEAVEFCTALHAAFTDLRDLLTHSTHLAMTTSGEGLG